MNNPAEKSEIWDIDRLIPYAKNSRTHSDEQIAQIAASMREWGFTNPVLIDPAGNIIAGHGRLLAARKLLIDKIPVVIADGWTDAQKQAYIIADNKMALNAGWDNDMLALELTELDGVGFDLDLTGFDADEIAALMPDAETDSVTDEIEYKSILEVSVSCESEDQQEQVYNMMTSKGFKCRILSM